MSCSLKVILILKNLGVQFLCLFGGSCVQLGQIQAGTFRAMGEMRPLIPADDGSAPDQVE